MRVAVVGATGAVGSTILGVMRERSFPAVHVSMGNPHAVAFVEDLADAGSLAEAPSHDAAAYPDGVNVEFVVRRGEHHVALRVHERGSGETRSCGTGVVAAAAVARSTEEDSPAGPAVFRVDVPGGTVTVDLDGDDAYLTGPAVLVADGTALA